MLVSEFKYYRTNYGRLREKYSNKYIVIKGKRIIGIYNSHAEAFEGTIKNEALGTFLIQQIADDNRHKSIKRNRFAFFNLFSRNGQKL